MNVTASRGRCEPGISRQYPNITPEPRQPKRHHEHTDGGVSADVSPALEDTICGYPCVQV